MMLFNKVNNLISKVMDIDDDGVKTMIQEVFDVAFQQRFSGHLNEGFGLVFGQFLEPCSQSSGKDHGGSIHGYAVLCG